MKTWKKDTKTNFHGQVPPYDVYCNARAVLKIDSIYKQGKNYHPQTYAEECIYTDVEKQKCSLLLIDGYDDGFFEVYKKKKTKNIFVICLGLQKLIINEQGISIRT